MFLLALFPKVSIPLGSKPNPMRLSTFLFLLSALPLFLHAQFEGLRYDLTLGERQSKPRNIIASKVLGQNAKGYLVLNHTLDGVTGSAKEGYYITQYNFKHEFVENKILEYKHNNTSLELFDIHSDANALYVLWKLTDYVTKNHYLFVQKFDKHKLIPKHNAKIIATAPYPREKTYEPPLGHNYDADIFEGNFHLKFSADSSKLLLYHNLYKTRKNLFAYNIWVFDRNYQLQWKRTSTSNLRGKLTDLKDIAIANEGTVFLLTKKYKKYRRERRKRKTNSEYRLHTHYKKAKHDSAILLSAGTRQLGSMRLLVEDKNVVCAGFFIIKKCAEGAAFFKIDKQSLQIKQQHAAIFGMQFRKREFGKIKHPTLRQLQRTAKGEYLLVGEEAFITDTSLPPKKTDSIIYWAYEEIVYLKLTPYGKIKWARLFAKKQIAQEYNNLLLSYQFLRYKDRFFLVYNTELSTKGKLMRREPFYDGQNSSGTVLAEIKPDGDLVRKILFTERKSRLTFLPSTMVRFLPQKFLFIGEAEKHQGIGSLHFSETDFLY